MNDQHHIDDQHAPPCDTPPAVPLEPVVGHCYFTMVLHPFRGWIRVGRQYGSREMANSWVPFVQKSWRGCRVKVEAFKFTSVNGVLTDYSRKKLAERYNIDVPNVTGQRTRHLVAGTLDPIVRCRYLF